MLFDTANKKEAELADEGFTGLGSSQNGEYLAAHNFPFGGLSVWNAKLKSKVFSDSWENGGLTLKLTVAFSLNARWLAATRVSMEQPPRAAVGLWDLSKKQLVDEFIFEAVSLRFSENGQTLLAIGRDGHLAEWEVTTGRKFRDTILAKGIVLDATWSPDNQYVAAVYADNSFRMFDVTTGQLLETIVGIEGLLGPVMRVSADGHYCGVQEDRLWSELVYIVQTEDGQEILTPEEFSDKYGWKNDPSAVPFLSEQQMSSETSEVEYNLDAEAWAKKLGVPLEISNSIGMKLRLVPPGEFTMGTTGRQIQLLSHFSLDTDDWKSRLTSETPSHQVRITQPFYFGIYEVTQEEFETVMGKNPSAFSMFSDNTIRDLRTPRFPVEDVTYSDAVRFCNALSRRENLLPNYDVDKTGMVTAQKGNGYRLPTEAEWEYACRAGSTGLFFFGDDSTGLSEYGWYGVNSGGTPHPVGEKKPNAFGLFDMHGNVWEWCQDWWDSDYYSKGVTEDPRGPGEGYERVCRGGGYYNDSGACRSLNRGFLDPESRHGVPGVPGFRVVRVIEPTTDGR